VNLNWLDKGDRKAKAMTDTMEKEGSLMKRENLLLNVVCIVMALGFLGLAGLSYLSSGNFISTDNLFFSSVAGMMALIFLLVPVTSFLADRKAKKAPAGEVATAGQGAIAGAKRTTVGALHRAPVRFTDTVDAKGRPIPPDVARMVETMKDR
jgi:cytochrome c biogenesis factor